MKTFSVVLFLFLSILACPSSAQNKTQILSVLWKIESPNTHKVSYLLGSIHFFGKEWVESFPKLDSLLNASSVFIAEWMGKDTVMYGQPQKHPAVKHLKATEIFGKDYNKVNRYFMQKTGEGISENIDHDDDPVATLNRMNYFLMDELYSGTGLKISPYRMDETLLNKAIAQHKICVQLDDKTIVTNIMADPYFLKVAVAGIVEFVDEIEKKETINKAQNKNQPADDSDLYNRGKHIYNFSADDSSGERLAEAETRNNLWMKKLPTYFDKDHCFIVVGINHLNGKDGIIMQLKKLGYKVTPVNL